MDPLPDSSRPRGRDSGDTGVEDPPGGRRPQDVPDDDAPAGPLPYVGRGLAPERSPAAILAARAGDAGAAPTGGGRFGRWGRGRPAGVRRPRVSLAELWRSAVSPRLLVLLVVLVAAAAVCVQLAAWQLDRAALRGAQEAIDTHAATLAAEPQPLADVLRTQSSFSTSEYAVGVEVVGEWEPEHQLLVVDRAVEGEPAVLVITALRLTDGPDAGAMIPVLRGWLPAGDVTVTADGATMADASVLAVPAGEVSVVGHLSNSEQHRPGGSPPGTTRSISTGALAGPWGGPTFSGYLVQGSHDGAAWVGGDGPLTQAPDPTIAVETGLNIQNLAYAIEWVIFGGFALWLWWRLVRDDALDRRDDALVADA